MNEQDLKAFMQKVWEVPERFKYMPIGYYQLRYLTILKCKGDFYLTLKELFNASFRGPALVLTHGELNEAKQVAECHAISG